MIELREYQTRAADAAIRQLWRRPLVVSPTGSGKSLIAREIIRRLGGTALFIAHRREILDQAASHLAAVGLRVGFIMAGRPTRDDAEVLVGSVQTLARRDIPPHITLKIADEAHHAVSATWLPLLEGAAPAIGMTASPFRLDGRGLGDLFKSIIVAAYTDELIDAGYLVAPAVYSGATPDVHNIPLVGADYDRQQLDNSINKPRLIANIVATWLRLAHGRRTVCFAVNREHSRNIVSAFLSAGIRAEHVDGDTPAVVRDATLMRLRTGETTIVSNVELFTEGWDLPALECVILARPTASLCLHLQTIGRVLRPATGKVCIVLDHAGNHHRHGFVTRRLVYSLDGRVKAQRTSEPLGMRQCPACLLLSPPTTAVCPACGASLERERTIDHVDGELIQLEDDHSYRVRVWESVREQQLSSGYADGWARHRFKDIVGQWPVVVGGELIDIKRATATQKRAVYEELIATAESKGLKVGWAHNAYRRAFGVWPQGFVGTIRRNQLQTKWAERIGGGR